jgi:hypothetical protein
MVSLARTVRSIRRVGLKQWWRDMQYIGDAKSGRLVGTDQCVLSPTVLARRTRLTLSLSGSVTSTGRT